MTTEWLPLTDYSIKYKVSVSTLRRRIKTEDIQYRFHDGKYLLLDEPLHNAQPWSHRPSLFSDLAAGPVAKKSEDLKPETSPNTVSNAKEGEPILIAANKLLTELKQAYAKVLQEKEEQLLHLHEEVADLKTLVKVLESENRRLRDKASGISTEYITTNF